MKLFSNVRYCIRERGTANFTPNNDTAERQIVEYVNEWISNVAKEEEKNKVHTCIWSWMYWKRWTNGHVLMPKREQNQKKTKTNSRTPSNPIFCFIFLTVRGRRYFNFYMYTYRFWRRQYFSFLVWFVVLRFSYSVWFLFWWYSQINSIYFGFLQFCAIPIGNTANQIALYCCSTMKQMCHISIKEIKHSAKFDKNVHFNQTAFERNRQELFEIVK